MKDNKTIAEFMGYDISTSLRDGVECVEYAEDNIRALSDTHYHTSWDWLMPVVIECFEKFGDTNTINYMNLNDALLTCNIDEVYKVVVEFIKSYNETTIEYMVMGSYDENGDLV